MQKLRTYFKARALMFSASVGALVLCAFLSPLVASAAVTDFINGIFYSIAFMVGGIFVTLGGLALDLSLGQLVFEMGKLMEGNIGASVNTVWLIVRDGFNLLFIFGLIYIGLRLIWDSDDAGTRRALGSLIVAALLINFSLFIAKFIIDFSNIAALQIYNLMNATLKVNGGGGVIENFFADTSQGGIAAYVLHLTGMQTVATEIAGGFGLAVMMMIFLIITGLVFLGGALMIITRFVWLCFYMIFSPVMFLGFIFPKLKHNQDKWWDGFLKQAFFAPAYLFCVYIALRVLASARTSVALNKDFGDNMKGMAPDRSGADAAGFVYDRASGEGFGAVLFLIIALGFMIASLLLANKMSIAGASTSMSMVKGASSRMRRIAGGATAGVAARAGRNTVGYSAQRLADSERLHRLSAKSGVVGKGARMTLGGSRAVADSSFDARRMKVGGKTVGNQLDVGEGKKGGFTSRMKEDEKRHKAFLKDLKTREVKENDPDVLNDKKVQEKQVVVDTAAARTEGAKTKAAEAARKVEEEKTKVAVAMQKVTLHQEALDNKVNDKRLATANESERIQTLSTEYTSATEERKKQITEEIRVLESSITSKNAQFDSEITTLKGNLDKANTEVQTVEASVKAAEVQVKAAEDQIKASEQQRKTAEAELNVAKKVAQTSLEYTNHTNYIKTVEGDLNAMSKAGAKVGAALGALAVALPTAFNIPAMAGGAAVGAAVGGVGGRVVDPASNYSNKTAANNLWKEYGKDGTEKAKSKKKEKELKILSEQLKDSDGDGKPDETEKAAA